MDTINQASSIGSFILVGLIIVSVLYLLLVSSPDNTPVTIAQWLYSVTGSPYSELDHRVEELQRLLPKAEVTLTASRNGGSQSTLVIKSKDVTRTYTLFSTFGGIGYVAA